MNNMFSVLLSNETSIRKSFVPSLLMDALYIIILELKIEK